MIEKLNVIAETVKRCDPDVDATWKVVATQVIILEEKINEIIMVVNAAEANRG